MNQLTICDQCKKGMADKRYYLAANDCNYCYQCVQLMPNSKFIQLPLFVNYTAPITKECIDSNISHSISSLFSSTNSSMAPKIPSVISKAKEKKASLYKYKMATTIYSQNLKEIRCLTMKSASLNQEHYYSLSQYDINQAREKIYTIYEQSTTEMEENIIGDAVLSDVQASWQIVNVRTITPSFTHYNDTIYFSSSNKIYSFKLCTNCNSKAPVFAVKQSNISYMELAANANNLVACVCKTLSNMKCHTYITTICSKNDNYQLATGVCNYGVSINDNTVYIFGGNIKKNICNEQTVLTPNINIYVYDLLKKTMSYMESEHSVILIRPIGLFINANSLLILGKHYTSEHELQLQAECIQIDTEKSQRKSSYHFNVKTWLEDKGEFFIGKFNSITQCEQEGRNALISAINYAWIGESNPIATIYRLSLGTKQLLPVSPLRINKRIPQYVVFKDTCIYEIFTVGNIAYCQEIISANKQENRNQITPN